MQKKIKYSIFSLTCLVAIYGGYSYFSKPTISVIMPVYNRADLLPRAIDSILTQTYQDFEFIIIDDASTDNSHAIAQQYAQRDSRIRLFKNTENKGISYSRNKGLKYARGKYIAVMDSDDQALPYRLEKTLNIIKENPEYVAVSGDAISLDNKIDADTVLRWKKYTKLPINFHLSFVFGNDFVNVASLFKHDFLKEHNIRYNESYTSAEDYDFWKQFIFKGGKLLAIYEPLTFVRRHFSNSNKYYDEMRRVSENIHKEILSQFFNPSKEEVKFNYSLKEKCNLLKKISSANKEKKIIPQNDVETYMSNNCPPEEGETYYITWARGEDYLYKNGNKFKKWLKNENVDVSKEKDILIVKDSNGKVEKYKKRKDSDEYFYFTDTNFELKHQFWHDFMVEDTKKENHFCRTDNGDCGTISKTNKNTIQVQWDNPHYPIETFIYNQSTKLFEQKVSK